MARDIKLYCRFSTGRDVVGNDAVAAACDFSQAQIIIDISGGEGTLLGAILGKRLDSELKFWSEPNWGKIGEAQS
jgi:hypothetical protein